MGSIADKYGRKALAIVFGITYSLSCLTKLSPEYSVLMLGRVLGGIATSLLFSVFESWMVYEHNKAGFQQEQLSRTFSLATLGNGVVAILSGILANILADSYGPVAPFMGALCFLIVSIVFIQTTWTENYGDASRSVFEGFSDAFTRMTANSNILLVGCIQSLFEGSMYTFVFMWTPSLQSAAESEAERAGEKAVPVPFGYVFATFMIAVMIGSALFRLLLRSFSVEQMSVGVFALATFSMILPIFFIDSVVVLLFSFCLFETACGMFWPCFGTLRGTGSPATSSSSSCCSCFPSPLQSSLHMQRKANSSPKRTELQ